MHIRTMAYPTFMAKFEARQICRVVDSLVFITENERDRFRRLGYKGPGSVIYNIVDPSSCPDTHPSVPNDSRFRIACLSNYSWERGIDRLVDVAAALAGLGRRDILFAIAGDMKLPVNLPGPLGEIGKHGGSLSDFVKQKGLEDMFLFLGHVQNPEQVLVACHLLVKPTRENNPWGRDIIEALAASKSVASVGTYDTFVEDGVTGILQTRFDASELAHRLVSLADNRASCIALGKAGCARVKLLCNGRQCAAALATVWREVYESRHGVG